MLITNNCPSFVEVFQHILSVFFHTKSMLCYACCAHAQKQLSSLWTNTISNGRRHISLILDANNRVQNPFWCVDPVIHTQMNSDRSSHFASNAICKAQNPPVILLQLQHYSKLPRWLLFSRKGF